MKRGVRRCPSFDEKWRTALYRAVLVLFQATVVGDQNRIDLILLVVSPILEGFSRGYNNIERENIFKARAFSMMGPR